jgi:hypothetical protein
MIHAVEHATARVKHTMRRFAGHFAELRSWSNDDVIRMTEVDLWSR